MQAERKRWGGGGKAFSWAFEEFVLENRSNCCTFYGSIYSIYFTPKARLTRSPCTRTLTHRFPCLTLFLTVQRRQSAKLFLQSSELGLPHSLTPRRVYPPSLWFHGEGHTCLWGEWMGASQFRRGDIHCDTLGIYVV